MGLAQEGSDVTCLDCHSPDYWRPLSSTMRFDHNGDTDFPLQFLHRDVDCKRCHLGNSEKEFHEFTVRGEDCADCHQDVHQNFWGTQCERCHTPEDWEPALAYRDHDLTLFPLVAAHHEQSCYLCHTSPSQTPPLDCSACHANAFIPDLPAHEGLTSNTDCSTCHGPTRWDQILAINHDGFFPIYSGVHWGRWNSCSTCHTQAVDYQTFTCFGSGCHSSSRMDSKHCEGSHCEHCGGFTYPQNSVQPEDCYFCHPRGNNSKCGD